MHIDFENDGYLVAREFFDETTIALMQTYWDFKWRLINFSEEEKLNFQRTPKKGETLTLEDDDVGDSYNFYSDHLMESIELNYGQKACNILKASLLPTYTYTRIYQKGSQLIPHQDRPECEVSATCPVFISDDRPSQICISNYNWWDIIDPQSLNGRAPPKFSVEEIKTKGDYSEVHLYPGDALFYKGCDRYHWRDPIQSEYMIQFFMHFVQAEGPHKGKVFDSRPYMGFPTRYKGITINN